MYLSRQLSLLIATALVGCHTAEDGSIVVDRPQPLKAPVPVGQSYTTGPADAAITLVVATDYQCPYCKRHEGTIAELMKLYEGRIRVVMKHQPLPFHGNARAAALAAEAAGKQGKFQQMHELLFERQRQIGEANFSAWAKELGLDVNQFEADVASAELTQWIDADRERLTKHGVRGTPSTWINGRFITGAQPLSKFVEVIAEELGESAPAVLDDGKKMDDEGC